jgi:serine/threonine protein kinase
MIIAKKYKIIEKLNHGEFGTIFKGQHIRTQEPVAIKIESITAEIKMLKREAQIYQYLGKAPGIPQVKWYGVIDNYNFMVLPLYGKSLSHQQTFSLGESIRIGKTLVKRLQYIHEKGLIHRDVKPDNFVIGQNGKEKDIYIIDFGLCKKYKDENDKHIAIKTGKTMIGTPNFVSIHVHHGIEPSRRDDLESVGYIMLYLVYNSLPWQSTRENEKIKSQKLIIEGPCQIIEYINYCRKLHFDETPNYEYIDKLLE